MTAGPVVGRPRAPVRSTWGREWTRRATLAALALTVLAIALAGVVAGTMQLGLGDVVRALVAFDGSREHLVITNLRLPRVAAGLLAGAALGVAGAIMQAATGNPLAAPDLLGINAGAAFCVVVATALIGIGSELALLGYAFAGAGCAAIAVFLIGAAGQAGTNPVRLVLAGAVLTAFLTSLTLTILIFDQSTLDLIRLWSAGSLSGRTAKQVVTVAPFILAGLMGALACRRQITTLSLGGDRARALGQDPRLWRTLAFALVLLLAGGAVALAGPIAFIGLIIPHIGRLIFGADYRWILPFSMIGGAGLLVAADLAGRTLLNQHDVPVGVTMALIGGPFFVWLARRRIGRPT